MGVHGSRSRSRSRSRSPKRQRRDRSGSPRRSRSPGRRRSSRSLSRSRSPHGFGRGGVSPSRGAVGPFGRLPGGIGTGGRPSAAALAAMGPGGGGITPPPWVANARLAPQVKSVLEALYTRGKLGPGDLEYACVEFLELLGPVAGMAVLEEFASLDFFRIRNLTAFFIGICKRVQNRAPPPPGRPMRGPDGGSPPPAGSMMRGRTLHRGPGGGGSGGQAAPSCSGGAGGTGLGASALQHGHSRPSRSPCGGPGTRRASPPLHFNMEDGSRSRSPPIQRRWVSKSPPPRRFNSKSPPLQRRWVSRSPAARRAGSKSPPPRRWVSKSPPPRRWVSRSPPSRRFSSKSPPPRRWVSKSPPKRAGSKSPPALSGQHRRSRHSRSPPPPPKPQRSSSPPGRDGSVSNHDASGTHTTAAVQQPLPPPPSLGQQQPHATQSNASTGSRTSAPGAGPVNVTSVATAVSASGCASASAATRPTVCEASRGHDTAAAPEAHAHGEGGAGHAPGGSPTELAAGVAAKGGQAAGSPRHPALPVAAAAAKAILSHGGEAGRDGGLFEPAGSAPEAGSGEVACSAAAPPLPSRPLDGAAGAAEPANDTHLCQPARAAAQQQEVGGFAATTTAAASIAQAAILHGEQQEPQQQQCTMNAEHHENGKAWPAAHALSPAVARGRASSGPADGLQQGTQCVGDGVFAVDLDALFIDGALLDHRLAASAASALQAAASTNIHGAAVAAAAAAGDMLAAVLAASANGLVGMALAAPLGGWTASEAANWDAQRTPVSGSDRGNSLGGMAGTPGIISYAKVPPPPLAGTSVLLDVSGQHPSAQGTRASPAVGLLGGVLSEALTSFGAGGAGACPHGGGGALRQAVTEHVKEVLKPAWRANKLTRETFKAVAKKAVDGVLATLPNNGIGSVYDTPAAVASFFSEARREVIGRLVEGVLANLAAGELQE